LLSLRAAMAVNIGRSSRLIEVGCAAAVLDKTAQGCGGCVIEGVVQGEGDMSHVGVYIACHWLSVGGDGQVHFVHTIAKHADCANIFAKWTR
jgi:hypothetical protein